MKDNEQKQEPLKDTNKSPSRIEVQNMLLDAKVDVARTKINWLLALFAILGVIVPFVFSLTQEYRVKNAITDMENSFKELSGKQLRKPKIICRGNQDELLQNSVFEIVLGMNTTYYINVHNQGDGLAGPIDAYLYFKEDKKIIENELNNNDMLEWEKKPCDNKNYSSKYFIGGREHISPQEIVNIPLLSPYFYPVIEDVNTYDASALLKVYYGELEPVTVPFTIKIVKKNN